MSLASTPHDNLTFDGGTIFSTKYLVGYFFCQVVSAGILLRIALQDFFQNRFPPPSKIKWSAPNKVSYLYSGYDKISSPKCIDYLTNRFHSCVRLYCNRSQMTS